MIDRPFYCLIRKYILNCINESPILAPKFFKPRDIVHCVYSLGCGGAERQLVTTVKGVAKHNLQQHVLCFSLSGESNSYYTKDFENININPIDVRTLSIPCYIWKNIDRRLIYLPRRLRYGIALFASAFEKLRPCVAHIWSGNVQAALAAILVGIPKIILAGRNLSPSDLSQYNVNSFYYRHFHHKFIQAIYRSLVEHPSIHLINNSYAGGRSYAKWLNIDPQRIAILYNGVDHRDWAPCSNLEVSQFRKRLDIADNRVVISGAMRFIPQKNPLLWLEAAEIVSRNTDAIFTLFGDGPLKAKMEAFIKKKNLSDTILLPGQTREMRNALCSGDVFLLSSAVEGLPNVIIEAQLLGVPVVTTNAGGASEAIENGITGWVVSSDDAKDIADKLLFTINDNEWRKQAINRAPEFIKTKFDIERMIKKTMQLYSY